MKSICLDNWLATRPREDRRVDVDGKQHYADGMHQSALASPRVYADTIGADRRLRLAGYEVYRFGGYEFRDNAVAKQTVKAFFDGLFARHGIRTG